MILFLLMFKIDYDDTIVDTFDMIEVNHYHNEWGVQVWSQIILWDWHSVDCKFHVEKWIMMDEAYVKTKEGRKKWEKAVQESVRSLQDAC